jgi:hypothetical protein
MQTLKSQLKIRNFIKSNWLLIAILLLGLFLRTYKAQELFYYSHDQDLAGWFIKDVIENRHLRLIGQETSTKGIFIGPIYYYMLIPFYIFFGMDPIGGIVMITVLGLFAIWSVYYVFLKVFGKNVGYIAAFIYSVSFYTVFNDREVVPTMPVIAWTVWFLYALNLLLKGKQKLSYLMLGLLIGLIWHLNIALVLTLPLVLIAQILSKKKFQIKNTKAGIVALIFGILPLLLFEFRHRFSQTRWFVASVLTDQAAIVEGVDKIIRTIHLNSKNITGLLWGDKLNLASEVAFIFLISLFVFLYIKKSISKKLFGILLIWVISFLAFFSAYSKHLSEYYLNGLIVVWILILSVWLNNLLQTKKYKLFGVFFLIAFGLVNVNRVLTLNINKSGYIEKFSLVREIKVNANEHSYPCVSVSYITDPGYNFGYRYMFWYENMHVNRPASGSPVYTIVFPLRDDIKVNKTFGALGLIYPDYSRYNVEDVRVSCSGENSNVTDPMWGLTQ